MSKTLAKVLDKPLNNVTKSVAEHEKSAGFPSEDVRLLAENKQKMLNKLKQLGLDPNDTTDNELYWALRARYQKDSQTLDRALGVNVATSFKERLDKADQLVGFCAKSEDSWLIKNSAAKKLLSSNPPKQTAKILHYRSIPSMIKREDVAVLFLIAQESESATWQKNITQAAAKLSSSDYELRPIKVVKLPESRLQASSGPDSYLVLNKLLGSLAIVPSAELDKSSVLSLTLLLLSGLQKLQPDGYEEALHELSPALRWWSDCSYLISDGKKPISFNLKDVAINHINNYEHEEAIKNHAGQSLWQELTSRYQAISDSLSESIPETDYNFEQPQSRLPNKDELAPEYVTVE